MELLERDAELETLRRLLGRVEAGDGGLAFVGGEAGVGKTSLVRRFAREAAARARVINVSCDGLSTPEPLGPLFDAAPVLGLDVERLFAEGVSRDRLFRAVLAAFDAPGVTVVVAEDAHWADEASLGILRFLGRHLDGRRLLLVVTFRDDELGTTHPLRQLLGDLATDARVYRLTPRPLSVEGVRRLAAASGVDPGELHRRTGGNPFFVTEALALGGQGVPPTVRDAVLARAARLSRPARAALETASALGAPIDLDLLIRAAEPAAAEIEECLAAGLLVAVGDDLAFRHELAREAIATSITPPRRRLIHAAILAALRAGAVGERDLARLAYHAEAAGDAAALEYAVAAAEQASAFYANREAAAQYARALRVAGALPDEERARLYERRSVTCYLSDQGQDALAARQAALAIRRAGGDQLKEGDDLRWLSRLYWFEGRRAEAETAGREAVRLLEAESPGPELAMAYSNLSQLAMLAADLEGAVAWGERAIALATTLGETETLIHAEINVGSARLGAGDPRGVAEIERARERALAAGMIDHAGRAATNLAWRHVAEYDLPAAERYLSAAIDYATEHDLDNYRRYLLATRSVFHLRRGEWEAALAEASPLTRRTTLSPLTRLMALTVVGTIQARRGQPESGATLDEALRLAEATGELQRLAPVRLARAERAWLGGDLGAARAELAAIRELAFDRGSLAVKGEVASMLVRLGEQDVPATGLAEPFGREVVGDWAGAAMAWEARGCPWEAATALLGGDEGAVRRALAAFERLGSAPAAALAGRRLRELGARGIPRGPYAAARTNPAGLTTREVEVLVCLAEGLRNAEIASRLFVSAKTVEHHISAILTKLDARSRAEAVRAAARLGVVEDRGSESER